MARSSKLKPEDRERVAFPVARRFLAPAEGEKFGAAVTAEDVSKAFGLPVSREMVYPLLELAVERGYVRLVAPVDELLAQLVADEYDLPKERIRVVDDSSSTVLDRLATATAGLVADRAVEVARAKKGVVHIAYGSGRTSGEIARVLAAELRRRPGIVRLVLHALSADIEATRAELSPIASFGLFEGVAAEVEQIGLFSTPLVPVSMYRQNKEFPVVAEAFEKAPQIDIAITSLASVRHEHGRFVELLGPKASRLKSLKDLVGDVQLRGFTARGPFHPSAGNKPVTLLEIDELVALAATPGKHVVLVSGPCGQCEKRKADALRPLLRNPRLRVWNWLVIDVQTARELLSEPN